MMMMMIITRHSGRQFNEFYESNFDPNTEPNILIFDNLQPGDLGPMDKEVYMRKYIVAIISCLHCRIMYSCFSW